MQQIIVPLQANWCILPSSEPPFGGPPSPQGEGFGTVHNITINYNLTLQMQTGAVQMNGSGFIISLSAA